MCRADRTSISRISEWLYLWTGVFGTLVRDVLGVHLALDRLFGKTRLMEIVVETTGFGGRLRADGFHVARVWEHDLRSGTWLKRVKAMLRRIDRTEKKK